MFNKISKNVIIDLLFNLLLSFAALFFLAFMMVSEPEEEKEKESKNDNNILITSLELSTKKPLYSSTIISGIAPTFVEIVGIPRAMVSIIVKGIPSKSVRWINTSQLDITFHLFCPVNLPLKLILTVWGVQE